jgi:two-component system alkaline phosphatase synthesis response regulator PhoP
MRRVLYVSDHSIPEQLISVAPVNGFDFFLCNHLASALADIRRIRPDAVVIDSDRQEVAALELCYLIKSEFGTGAVKTVMISSSQAPESEISSFKAGADDFVNKPIRQQAFLSRLSRRVGIGGDSITLQSENNSNKLRIDRDAYTVHFNRRLIRLSRKEFELLHLLAGQPAKVFSRDEIFEKVWKREGDEKDRTIDVHVLRIRKKINDQELSVHISFTFC